MRIDWVMLIAAVVVFVIAAPQAPGPAVSTGTVISSPLPPPSLAPNSNTPSKSPIGVW
jgi:hypothetical protein